jgi:flagellar protein FliS
MNLHARDTYLETQIATATPQKLRLIVIEAALRFAQRTAELWRENDDAAALEMLIRCRTAVSELIAGVRATESPLARQVLEIYLFVFRALALAQQERSTARLQEVIAILEEDRLTWQQLCEQLPAAPQADPSRHDAAQEITAPRSLPFPSGLSLGAPVERLSLDA